MVVGLNDLEWEGQVVGAWDTWHIAFYQWIKSQPVSLVFLLLCETLRRVRQFTILYNAQSSRDGTIGTQFPVGTGMRCGGFDVVVVVAHALPQSAQVWPAICSAADGVAVGWLRVGVGPAQRKRHRD